MIEAEFAFFQVMKKLLGAQTIELLHPPFGKGPEALDAVDMIGPVGKFIIGMIDPKMFGKTDINQTVVTAPAVGVDNHVQGHFSPDNGLQRALF